MEWIKCSDKMPKRYENVLFVGHDKSIIIKGWYEKSEILSEEPIVSDKWYDKWNKKTEFKWISDSSDEGRWISDTQTFAYCACCVSHWMPVPESPK